MARTTMAPGSASRSEAAEMPAAMETTHFPATSPARAGSTSGNICGLTPKTIRPACRATVWLSVVVWTPNSAKGVSFSGLRLESQTRSGGTSPCFNSPRRIAPFILPAPTKPKTRSPIAAIVIFLLRASEQNVCRRSHHTSSPDRRYRSRAKCFTKGAGTLSDRHTISHRGKHCNDYAGYFFIFGNYDNILCKLYYVNLHTKHAEEQRSTAGVL